MKMKSTLILASMMEAGTANASSHREAPFVTENPKVDATDFYVFRSYEPGRAAFTTFVANYIPLQDGYGGPNFFPMDPDALYEIHVDNTGDSVEDITFAFRFRNKLRDLKLTVGTGTAAKDVSVALTNIGQITATSSTSLAVDESYSINVIRGDRRTGTRGRVTGDGGAQTFRKPTDNYGVKTFGPPNGQAYEAYARSHVFNINIPGCATPGRVFVGQRKDPFYVTLGQVFDLINVSLANITGACNTPNPATFDDLEDKNITAIVLEVPTTCLTAGAEPVIGAWTSASLRQARVINPDATFDLPAREGGAWTQVSRLGAPLVNEVVIGLKDKNKFNGSEPKDDPQFIDYVTNPTFPKIVDILFGAAAMANLEPRSPRGDLVDVFLIGLAGANKSGTFSAPGEFLRLNTAVPATELAMQNPIGFLAGDLAGFPNGRRPYDDVTDVVIRAAMGALVPGFAPGAIPYTDCSRAPRSQYTADFPYLGMPIGGGKPGF